MHLPAHPMRILVVTGIFPPDRGGPASYVPRIATALLARGHSVEVICLSDSAAQDDSGCGFRVHRIRRGLFFPCRVLLTAFAIWRAALRHDLVYVNGLGAESALGAALAGRPTVHKIVGDYAWERAVGRRWFRDTLDEYQTGAKTLRLRILDEVRTFPLRLAKKIVVPSAYLRRIVCGWGFPSEKVRVIYNSVPPPGAAQGRAATLPAWGGRTLITVCRLMPWKGVDALIRLLPALPDTRLVVAGDGYMRAEYSALAGACGVAERVLFLGDVPHPAVRGYLGQADAFVLNSTYEGLPHVVLEAMAAGVPVIATDAGGTGEVVEHNVTGLLIPVGDASALQAAVERLWSDPSLGRQLVDEAARLLGGQFDFDTMVNATESELLAAVEPQRAAQSVAAEEPR